jgi:hypothetical protein
MNYDNAGSNGVPTTPRARVGSGHMGQFNTVLDWDWMAIRVCASNNRLSKLFSHFFQYIFTV